MIPLEWILAILYLFGGLNEAFLDCVFYIRPLRRSLSQGRENPTCEEAELHSIPEKRIAIMVPAWDEAAVIGAMLESTCDRLEYDNYDIFVGTYPNDEATQMEVSRAAFDRPHIHRVVCPNAGPTSKADCLNWVVETIKLRERESGERYEIFCLQDAEDVVHPLTLKVFNRFVPEYDLVQLPVIPYERHLGKLTGGTYLDEFAEVHLKGLTSRLAVGGMVPSAGVGTAFSRAACDELANQTNHVLFPPVSLTEDYDFSFRLFRNGRKSGIAEVWVDRADARGRFVKELVAIREFFPAVFGDAVRQKQRWMLGIAFQGAQKLGWGTGWRERYMLLRDRIGVLTSVLNLGALFIFFRLYVNIGWGMLAQHQTWKASLPPFYPSHALSLLIDANLVLLANRIIQRARCVGLVASRRQMLLAPIRIVWSNVIDFYCTVHAIRRFTYSSYSGKPLKWLKTAHEFPNVEALLQRHRPLGDLLLEYRFISPVQLRKALGIQSRAADRNTPLGQILLSLEAITKEQLLTVLEMQGKSRILLDEANAQQARDAFPAAHAAELDLTPDLPTELATSPNVLDPLPTLAGSANTSSAGHRVLAPATPAPPAHPPILAPIAAEAEPAPESAPRPLPVVLRPRPLPITMPSRPAPVTPAIAPAAGPAVGPPALADSDLRNPRTAITRIIPIAAPRKRFAMLQTAASKLNPSTLHRRFVVAIGTRPEAIKLAPLIRELRQRAELNSLPDPVYVCATGQHMDMVSDALALFGITTDRNLALMAHGQSLASISARVLTAFETVLSEVKPEWVIVQGDTSTTAMAGLAAFYAGIKVAHVEAGLRTDDLANPFPEEFNRRMVSIFATVHFAATPIAKLNLLREGVSPAKILVTGNTGIDALRRNIARLGLPVHQDINEADFQSRPHRVLITAHRRENLEQGIDNLCAAIQDLAQNHPGRFNFVWPLHPNPQIGERARRLLGRTPGVTLTGPASYDRLLELLHECDIVLTDSGGIQEEAPSFGKPVLILREATERPEGVEAGIAWLVGTDPTRVVAAVERLIRKLSHQRLRPESNPYGDGRASHRIANFFSDLPVEEFMSDTRLRNPGIVELNQAIVRAPPSRLTLRLSRTAAAPPRSRPPACAQVRPATAAPSSIQQHGLRPRRAPAIPPAANSLPRKQ